MKRFPHSNLIIYPRDMNGSILVKTIYFRSTARAPNIRGGFIKHGGYANLMSQDNFRSGPREHAMHPLPERNAAALAIVKALGSLFFPRI